MNYKELPGLVFVFESNQAAHYKNQRMFEMDASYGKFSRAWRAYMKELMKPEGKGFVNSVGDPDP
jgi:hypothetical protein